MKPSDECYTPGEWIGRARLVLRTIDLDPASCVEAQRVVRAKRFYTIEQDGLSKKWNGNVWLNKPYSKPAPWVRKLLAEYDEGRTRAAVVLVNSRTGASWFRLLAARAWRCEKRKRIAFWGPGTRRNGKGNGRTDSCFFYLGTEPARFVSVFEDVGTIVQPASRSVTESVTRACKMCGRSLRGFRTHATVCSSKCRQRAYRASV